MNEQELRAMVERLVTELAKNDPRQSGGHAPAVPHSDLGQRSPDAPLPDITRENLREQYLVKDPENGGAFLDLKRKTSARLGVSRAGARYKTATMLRVRADHAAAQDSVFSLVAEDFPAQNGYTAVQTLCTDKDEYLTRPDKGRRFDDENQKIIQATIGKNQKIALVVGDGLSSLAIEKNAVDCALAIAAGLKTYGLDPGKILFVKYCRVGASDHIGSLTGCELVCLLVGERPGLTSAESMSCYLTYAPKIGIAESKRTVVSNIHKDGTTAVEAGAHIAELICKILEQKASGLDLKV
ncbi:MAG: ethanolamine ammonia-lyase subunit EutC [Oscillospiraceae bacterium]